MDIITPLKGITDTVREIADLVTNFRTCTDEWKQFLVHIQSAVKVALQPVDSINGKHSEVKPYILTLQGTLDGIVKRIEARQKESFLVKLGHFRDHSVVIDDMRREVDNALELFKLGIQSWTGVNVEKLVQGATFLCTVLSNNDPWFGVLASAARTLDPLLGKLRYIDGASWDKHRVCLANTRQHIIDSILSWVNEPANAASNTTIFLLTGVAGSGKSAIAHTISQRLHETGQLATSFFFDREIAERNHPRWLMSTIVFDLCQRNDSLSNRIVAALEEEKVLVGAPISRQFQQLVLDPSQGFYCIPPLVIVLDGLDEGCDNDLLQILTNEASKLPTSIRLVVTARVSPETDSLRRKSHVCSAELDIHDKSNIDDITLFISSQLKEVANFHDLGDDWPGQQLATLFQGRAEGLFLWVATTCSHLKSSDFPTRELHKIASGSMSRSSAESKMDDLYSTILHTCDWDDEEFAESCRTLLGAVVATKSPLTLHALNTLFGRVIMDSEPALRRLGPLMTGLSNKPELPPVRLLHKSLRDFLTLRAAGSNRPIPTHMFAVDEKLHSQTLGVLCLEKLNLELHTNMAGVGYCSKDESEQPGIPAPERNTISEELLYACRYWVDHIVEIDLAETPKVLVQLEQFLKDNLITWIELTTTFDRYEGLSRIANKLLATPNTAPSLRGFLANEELTNVLCSLASRLKHLDRREEAVIAAEDEVIIHRSLTEDGNTESQIGLARSLCHLSIYLEDLAQREEALAAAGEAVTIQRGLAVPADSVHSWDFARSLWRQSVGYAGIGRHKDALVAAEEGVEIQRRLMEGGESAGPTHRNDFAKALHNLSDRLHELGCYERASEVSAEMVSIYRQLLVEQPSAFKLDLARSLRSFCRNVLELGRFDEGLILINEAVELGRELAKERQSTITYDLSEFIFGRSVVLSNLDRNDEALAGDQEVVALRRQLSKERPAVYTSSLARSLNNLALRLSAAGRPDEALASLQETVELHRQLAKERPAVFTPDYAQSLHNLAVELLNLGRHGQALAPNEESVGIYRELVKERPAVFTSPLANCLHSLAAELWRLGRREEALVSTQEAVVLRRQLAEERPSAFKSELASSLRSLAIYLSNLGRHDEAAEVRRERDAIGITHSI